MDGFHIGEGRHHHFDFGRLEDARIAFQVVVLNLDVRLREKAEDLRQKIPFAVGKLGRPVLAVLAQRHFLRDPVDLLLLAPEFEGPGITERLVGMAGGQETGLGLRQNQRAHSTFPNRGYAPIG
jgi:hypothetical protein